MCNVKGCLLLTLCFGLVPQFLAAQSISSLTEFSAARGQASSQSREIDLEATVNFCDPRWNLLYVQDGDIATYVQLHSDKYSELTNLSLGTRIRIVGSIGANSYLIKGRVVEVISTDKPAAPVDVKFDDVALGELWSRRVASQGIVEAILVEDQRTQLILRDGNTRFFLRCLQSFDAATLSQLVDAEIKFTATLAYVVDEFGRAKTVICHAMADDEITISTPGRDYSAEAKTIASISELHSELSTSTGEEDIVRIRGQIGYRRKYQLFVLEDDSRQSVSLYGPFEGALAPGDLVEVVATRSNPTDSLGMNKLPPLAVGRDTVGRGVDLIAKVVYRSIRTPLPPEQMLSASRIVADRVNGVRGTVFGNLIGRRSDGFVRELQLEQDGVLFTGRFFAEDDQYNAMELSSAQEIRLTGLVEQTKTTSPGESAFVVLVPSVDGVEIQRRWTQIDSRTIVFAAGLIAAFGIFAAAIVWRLRRQVGKQDKHLAQVIARLNTTYDAVREALLVVDRSNSIVASNSRVADVLGIRPADFNAGQNATQGSSQTLRRTIAERIQDNSQFLQLWDRASQDPGLTDSVELTTVDKPPRVLNVRTAPVVGTGQNSEARIWSFDDISDRKQLEAKLLHLHKMEAVGRLAGGVAHDFNNLLLVMTANLELAQMSPEATIAESATYLDPLEQATDRASKLVSNLLGFSRKSNLEIRIRSPNDCVERAARLLKPTLKPEVRFEANLAATAGNVRIDEAQLEQVLLNIFLNARDSLSSDGGTICVSTENVPRSEVPGDPTDNKLQSLTEATQFVRLRISDDGAGMRPAVRENVFDPFFTTKENGKGTGLGLSMALGIIQQHGGTLTCRSEPGKGSVFDIYLPCSDEPLDLDGPDSVVAEQQPSNAKRILVVDDDNLVRESIANALRASGFEVVSVSDGLEAVNFLTDTSSCEIDLVLLDFSMPVMSGGQAFREIHELDPNLPVIICSGFPADVELEFADLDVVHRPFAIIAKPYRMNALRELLSDALAEDSAGVGGILKS